MHGARVCVCERETEHVRSVGLVVGDLEGACGWDFRLFAEALSDERCNILG